MTIVNRKSMNEDKVININTVHVSMNVVYVGLAKVKYHISIYVIIIDIDKIMNNLCCIIPTSISIWMLFKAKILPSENGIAVED